MNFILLIRHSESESNIRHLISHDAESYPLTEKGIEQSKILGKELKKLKVDDIYSSPILRCRQTAHIIAEYLNCPIIYDDRVKERFFGKFNNKRIDPLDWKTFLVDEASKKCVEEWNELYSRIYNLIRDVKNKNVVIVTHYDLIRAFIAKQIGLEDELSAWGIVVPNASLTIVLRENNNYKVKAIGIPPIEEMLSKTIENLNANNI